GQLEPALEVLETASSNYQQVQDEVGLIRAQLNIVRVLRLQGQLQKALETLNPIVQKLDTQLDSRLKVAALRQVGESFQLVGNFAEAEKALAQSLQIAQSLGLNSETTSILLALGDLARIEFQTETALDFYERAARNAPAPTTKIPALVQKFALLVSSNRLVEAQKLRSQIQGELDNIPLSRELVYARINFGNSVFELENKQSNKVNDGGNFETNIRRETNQNNTQISAQVPSEQVVQLLTNAIEQAHNLGDARAESYALGTLGNLYEATEQWQEVQQNTQKALLLAQSIGASDIAYQWHWQLGRAFKAQGNSEQALIAYREAYLKLQSIRSSIVALNSKAQFSFREKVEPVYREYVELLLESPDEQQIEQAQQVIESLQIAELTNFFRADCDLNQLTKIEEIDTQAAVIYPIILPNRLEIVLSIPNQTLRHYSVPIDRLTLEDIALELRYQLDVPDSKNYLDSAQQLYDWIIRPLEADLAQSKVQTLAFVLDGALRNIPVAALHDGEQYLIQKHAIALTPSLQLINPQPLANKSLKALVGALTEAVKVDEVEYKALPAVEEEVATIKSELPKSDILKNETFTNSQFAAEIQKLSFPVVHLATHGQFGSTAEDTFIVTYDEPIDVNQLSDLLRNSSQANNEAIELLIFSACETASGDPRTALGLAGVAVRSGARSTIATLWQVNDNSTSKFMDQLYDELGNLKTTKAEALRNSQLTMLEDQDFQHPYYWAPFVLVGNWL
ncbi:MAG: CHAT domain-containing protein, partial [Xenococcus sp. (in: cyanobacteria)]